MTQVEVINALNKKGIDITQSYYSRVEQGFHLPTPQIIEAIAEVLQTSYADLTKHLVRQVNNDGLMTIANDRTNKNIVIQVQIPEDWDERTLTTKEIGLVYSLIEGMLKRQP